MKTTILEACTDCVQSAINAQKGGADRIELCSNLVIGGLTPGKALFDLVKKYTNIKTRVLLRPRYGDYCYDQYEFEQLKEEVQMYCEMGADGVVIGMLNPDGTLDTEHMAELIKAAGNKEKALHRAFDVCIDPMKALEEAIELGFDTILTSGHRIYQRQLCSLPLRRHLHISFLSSNSSSRHCPYLQAVTPQNIPNGSKILTAYLNNSLSNTEKKSRQS